MASSASLWIIVALIFPSNCFCHVTCGTGDVVIYDIQFTTNWTREVFPKQYPEFRPPAQWTRVVGISHNSKYKLFQLGVEASMEVKLFAETGKQEILGNGNEANAILDEFFVPAIKNGSGTATANFFVDSKHSKVSMLAKIVPSPDWFVGIDSLELCSEGHWIDSAFIEASPLDAGTDSGYTFTAPNWSTEPPESIYKITSRYPRHPANSFYYPQLTDLPPIATFTIKKKRTYKLQQEQANSLEVKDQEKVSEVPPLPSTIAKTTQNFSKSLEIELNQVLPWKHIKKKAMRKKKRSKSHGMKCRVGEWTAWSVCNGPCGQSIRTRNITKPGPVCPPLLQERTCGCTKYIFNW